MPYNVGFGYNRSAYDRNNVSILSFTDLQFLKCANWEEGPNHGGIATDYAVTTCWDYISEYENINGATDYRKGFIKNFGESSTGTCIIRPSFVLPNELVGRFNITITQGTASDNMTNKPADSLFASSLSMSLDPGESVPIWLNRVITAGGSPALTYLGLKMVLTVTNP
jgi:hypothetical protein